MYNFNNFYVFSFNMLNNSFKQSLENKSNNMIGLKNTTINNTKKKAVLFFYQISHNNA